MKVIIHYSGSYEDEVSFECETMEEAREKAHSEGAKRGWNPDDCWSEVEQ